MINTPPPTSTEQPAPNQDQDHREQVRRELEHRFRHGLRANQVNPLLHLLMHYKLEQQR
ncbi:hypothetical protein [Aquabacterium sp. NJ1]|uniref:hypothetical protein n=1 Tax=Aquabacterium sp. NJ1 TaxID=1538295 RepID=UPI0013769870|nr:hypothetical protein [Aquabacterium sp. NJ1]